MTGRAGDPVIDEVARRFAQWRSGLLDEEAERSLEAWLSSSPRHAELWEQTLLAWDAIAPLQADLAPAPIRSGWRAGRYAVAAGLVAMLGLVGLVALLAFGRPSPSSSTVADRRVALAQFASSHGRRNDVMLPDGSSVTLDADSKVSVRYAADRRDVVLDRGRALFTVAHDPSRPFGVQVGVDRVVALGTKFMVGTAAGQTDVALVRGRVRVTGNSGQRNVANSVELTPGQLLTTSAEGGWRIGQADMETALSWTHGMLVFESAPLRRVVEEMNRYAIRPIRIADPQTGEKRLTVVVAAGDTETLVDGVRRIGIAKARRTADGVVEFYSQDPTRYVRASANRGAPAAR